MIIAVEGAASFRGLIRTGRVSELADPLGQIAGYINEQYSGADYQQALRSAALSDSAGVIFIWVAARDKTIGIDEVGDEPGLKSVATTTASPASIISRAGG